VIHLRDHSNAMAAKAFNRQVQVKDIFRPLASGFRLSAPGNGF